MSPTTYVLMMTFRIWLVEIPIAAVNAFVLMDRVYAPRFGALRAHRIAMTTRIGWVVLLALVLVHVGGTLRMSALMAAGLFWMLLWLVFEWGGSLLIGRPVREILVGWHVERGYLWPYVLVAYLLSPLAAGLVTRAARG
jgi:hypothetical protein